MAIVKSEVSESINSTTIIIDYDEFLEILTQLGIDSPDGADVEISYRKSNGSLVILNSTFKTGDAINFKWKVALETANDTTYTITNIDYTEDSTP